MAQPGYSIYATSLEDVPVTVTGPYGVNPTATPPEMAFLTSPPPVQPSSLEWNSASWVGTTSPYIAMCLVGPGGIIQLDEGTYYTWVKFTATPEIPVKYAGVLLVS